MILMIHPYAIGLIVIVALGMFAPHFLGPIGRFLGKSVRREIERRLGITPTIKRGIKHIISESPQKPDPPARKPLPTLVPEPIAEMSAEPMTPPGVPTKGNQSQARAFAWTIAIGVLGIAGVLLWILLQSR